MRIALVSDIHGNLPALEAVLDDITRLKPDRIVCLGDVAAFGPQPRQVLARLREMSPAIVMGNTDAWLLDPKPHPIRDENSQRVTEIELWAAEQLTDDDRAFIRNFQPTITLPLGADADLLCYHGSPRSFHDAIHATTPEEELELMFAGHQALVLAGGHTHEQFLRRYHTSYLINPGSVGLPFERLPDGGARNPAWAEYALVGWENGRLGVDFRRVPFELDALIAAVQGSDMPHGEWWIGEWWPGKWRRTSRQVRR